MKKIILFTCTFFLFCFVNAQHEISRHWLKGAKKVEFNDYKILIIDADDSLVNYKIKGICYSIDPYNLHLLDNIETHIDRWKALGVNSIRTYRPLAKYRRRPTDPNGIEYDIAGTKAALDKIAAAGLTVLVGFSNYHDIQGNAWEGEAEFEGQTGVWYYANPYRQYLANFGNHPAILGFAFGNEYNYHPEWFEGDIANWLAILKNTTSEAKTLCQNKPSIVVHGEVPAATDFGDYFAMPDLDGIFVNVYRGTSFYDMFTQWALQTVAHKMPLVVAEYGRSSQSGAGENSSDLQVSTIVNLWTELKENFATTASGGYVFSYIDEPWKGEEEYNPIIGSEAHLGLYFEDGIMKPAGTAFANQDEYPNAVFENNNNKKIEHYTDGNTLYITTITSEIIEIYDTKGAFVASFQTTAGKTSQISLKEGVYLVKSKNNVNGIKVLIKY